MANVFEAASMTLKNGMTLLFKDAKARLSLEKKYGEDNPPPHIVRYGVCSTAAATVAKEVEIEGITELTAGLSIVVKFTYSNTAASPTLNVNGLGAKDLMQYTDSHMAGSVATTGWQAGATVLLTYDGTAWFRDQGYNTNSTYSVPGVLCTTAAATAAKATSYAAYYALRTGSIFIITFRYANTKASALTLNVNSTGAKPIYINGTASSSSNYTLPAGTYLCYYDGTAYHLNTTGVIPKDVIGVNAVGMNFMASPLSSAGQFGTLNWNVTNSANTNYLDHRVGLAASTDKFFLYDFTPNLTGTIWAIPTDAIDNNILNSSTNYSTRTDAANAIWNSMDDGKHKIGRVQIGGTNYTYWAMRNSSNYAVVVLTTYSGATIYKYVKTNGTVSGYVFTGTADS